MKLGRIAACSAALSTVVLALSAQSANAAPALATTNVNLRQGPGTTYQVVTTIPGGSNVDVTGCSGEWCSVTWHGQSGYVIATSLDQGGGAAPPSPPPAGAPPGGPVAVYPGAPPPPPDYVGPPVYAAPPAYYYGPSYYGYGPYYGGWHRRW